MNLRMKRVFSFLLSALLISALLLNPSVLSANASSVSADDFVNYALQNCVGVPYVSGGRTTSGFDCCGLVWYVCNHFGIDIGNGNQRSQINYGSAVSYSLSNYASATANLQKGDLIFFDYDNTPPEPSSSDHVGIYVGNGQILQAHTYGVNSRVDNLSGGWIQDSNGNWIGEWKFICGIRRVLDSGSTTPGKPALKNFTRSYASGATTSFYWDETANTTHYNMYVDRMNSSGDWERTYTWHYANSGFSYAFPDGIYRVLLQSTNSNASGWPYTDGDWVLFAVGSHTHNKGSYAFYEAVHPHCDCYTCSICGEIWRDTSSSNYMDSCLECHRPAKPVITGVKDTYYEWESITINWTVGSNTTHCNYWLYQKNGDTWKTVHKIDYASGPVIEILEAGDYRIEIVATNSDYWEADGSTWLWNPSAYVYFTVYDNSKVSFDPAGGSFADTVKICELSGINTPRGQWQLIVFTGDGLTVDTNYYGFEVAVNKQGMVVAERSYGDENHLTIPPGGFVLSGNGSNSVPNADFVAKINIGDYVAFDKPAMKVYHYTDYEEYLSEQKRVPEDGSYGNLPIPTKEGCYFNGWVDELGQFVDYYKTLTSTTLTAQWADDDTPPAEDLIYNGHKYARYEYNMTWETAMRFCEEHGGHLVTITSAEEQSAVEGLIKGGRNLIYYIGCSDATDHGNYTWITGEPFSYSNWDPQLPEPSGSEDGFNYGGIVNKAIGGYKQFGEWLSNADDPDELNAYRLCNYGFICEIDTICDHHYIDAVTEPTCTEQGYTTHTCEYCGDSYTDTYVPALKHDLIHHEAQAPTCTRIGWEAYDTCSRCDYSTYVEIKELGHDLIHHEAQAPTCTVIGWEAYDTCSRCDYSTYVEIKALDHDLIHHEAQAATCTEIGWEAYDTCSRCDYSTYVEIKALDHDLIHHEAKAPTCTEIGWKAYDTCSRCDYSTYVEIKELGHDLIHHEAQAPTCTEIGWEAYDTCSRCDYSTYVEKAALEHDYTAVVTAPTCTEKGYTTYTCSRCGDSYVADEVAALEHTPGAAVEENRIDPTCTADGGFDTATYCTVCGAELSRVHTDLAALEHNWDDGVIDPAATCTTDGVKTYTCKRCGETKTEAIAAYGHTPGESAKENEVTVTCTTAGSYDIVIRCTTCNEILFSEHFEIDALDHNWDDGVIDPAATCTTNGVKTFTCRRCGEKKTETIAASGHTPGESAKENEVAATCTTAGSYDMAIRCTTCDEILYTEHYESAALGHDWNDGEVTTPATATTDGVKTFTCKRCGATKTEAIPATGEDVCKHENTHPEHKDATCVEAGFDKMICDKCGAVVSEETIPALGHDLVADEAVAATCTATGLTAGEHCTRCDYKLAQETVPALGHDWDEGKVTTPATETTNGVKTFTCKRCGATKTETIPATGGEDKPCDGGKDCPSYKFKDVNYGDWYHEAVDFAVKNGLFNGMSDTTFEPNTPMTRGMLVTVLWRYEGQPEGGTNNFADVKDGEWYATAVAWAASKGIVNGVGNGKFDPNGKITREQLAAILYRYSESKGFDTSKTGNLNTFPDAAKVSDWARTAYSWAVGEGLIGGNVINGKTLLDPQGNATRAQVATILMRYIKNIAHA